MELFDLKTTFQFETIPGIDKYNMPLYSVQSEGSDPVQSISYYPVYQGFLPTCFVNGFKVPFYTERSSFWNTWSNVIQPLQGVGTGSGSGSTVYTFNLPYFPAIPGHIDMSGIIKMAQVAGDSTPEDPPFVSTFDTNVPTTSVLSSVFFTATAANGENIVVQDSGQFLDSGTGGDLYGLLMSPGAAPYGNTSLDAYGGYSTTSNTVNYNTGVAYVRFPVAIPDGTTINAQCYYYNQGIPLGILFYNNTLQLRPPPNIQYLVSIDAYLSPAAFMTTTDSLPFGYMAEYLARGAAQKMLSDTGDVEQFNFYQPLYLEQKQLVWKRSQRIKTSTRTPTIYSVNENQNGYGSLSGGVY